MTSLERTVRNSILAPLRALVDEQAEDEGLWFGIETIREAYIQQALRKLHDAIEEIDKP